MIRFERIIGKLYTLGTPTRGTQAQLDILNFLGDDSMIYYTRHWNIPMKYKTRLFTSDLVDHLDFFKCDITLIPYLPDLDIFEVDKLIKSDVRMRLCMKYGLQCKIVRPDPEIFKEPKFAKCTALIILHSDSWTDLRKNVRSELNAEYKAEWKQKFDEED